MTKAVSLILHSADKTTGTNARATFKVDCPALSDPEFQAKELEITLDDMAFSYPTNTTSGIINVSFDGAWNTRSYTSSSKGPHSCLGVMSLSDGKGLEYPPAALPNPSSTLTNRPYGNGTYVKSMSSQQDGNSLNQAFNKTVEWSTGTNFSAPNNYTAATGLYPHTTSSMTASGTTYYGEHVSIQLPEPIVLSSYTIFSVTDISQYPFRSPTDWVIGGSMDGVTWTLLDTQVGVQWPIAMQQTFTLPNNMTPFTYYRMLATRVGNSNTNNYRSNFQMGEWVLYGTPQLLTSTNRGDQSMHGSVTGPGSMFNSPITMSITSPSGIDLTGLSDWTAKITVRARE